VKDENGDLLAESHNILNRCKSNFSQLLNVHGVSNAKEVQICTAEPLLPEPRPFEVEIAIITLRSYKSLDIDHIPTELIQAGDL
jgi:hypothetical protein